MSLYQHLNTFPEDPILSLSPMFAVDPRMKKINLGVGAYRGSSGLPYVLSCVRNAERAIFDSEENKEYLPIDGIGAFNLASQRLIFGKESKLLEKGLAVTVQTLGASGALFLGAALIAHILQDGVAYLPGPTWPNHPTLMRQGGLLAKEYPYFDFENKGLDFERWASALRQIPPRSVVLLHTCCHNPTGNDPSKEQWREISNIMREGELIPFFDFAYQGFGEGFEEDAYAIRLFAEMGHEMLVANSFSKNLGLYGERVGSLSVIIRDTENRNAVLSNLKKIIRGAYSTPPKHGARIAEKVLGSVELSKDWSEELSAMRIRIAEMRGEFASILQTLCPGSFEHLSSQKGFFSYLCIGSEKVERLRTEYGIYIPSDGRVNIAGLTHENVQYAAKAVAAVQ